MIMQKIKQNKINRINLPKKRNRKFLRNKIKRNKMLLSIIKEKSSPKYKINIYLNNN